MSTNRGENIAEGRLRLWCILLVKLEGMRTFSVKVRDVIKCIEADGWYLARTRGGHRHYMHPTKKGIVTISGQPGKDMPIGTMLSVFKQAQIERERDDG